MEISEQAKKAAAWIVAFLRNPSYRPNYSMVEGNIQEAINQSLQENTKEGAKEYAKLLAMNQAACDKKLQEKDAEIGRLNKEHRDYKDTAETLITHLTSERDTLHSKVEQLKQHATHFDECLAKWSEKASCTCGLSDLLKGVE